MLVVTCLVCPCPVDSAKHLVCCDRI